MDKFSLEEIIKEGVKQALKEPIADGKSVTEWAAIGMKAPRWISVKDRLPNSNGCYIVWRPHFYPDSGMPAICYFDGSNTWHDSYGVDFERILNAGDVTHWQPLPEAPKEANVDE